MTHEQIIIALTAALALSEALALIPGIKANSVFQLVVNVIKSVLGKKD
jgi:hypothetical protein